jgi:DNA-binding transcriptional regulator YdaS (Cro superfamily)
MADDAKRDEGLRRALQAAGGINGLARLLGMTAPSVLVWRRVPSHRILQVERVTGIPREELRPDLYRKPAVPDVASTGPEKPSH